MFGASPIRAPSFSEILDDIVEEAGLGRSETLRAREDVHGDMDWLFHLLAVAASQGHPRGMSAAQEAPWEPGLEIPAARDDEESVAAELALSSVRSLAELKQLRRAFALRNHPDLLHPTLQAYATQRMKIANMLFDQRGKELARAA